jgi:putative phosphoribosyl transferase
MIVHELKTLFKDRQDAGTKLAAVLSEYAGSDTVVLAIPMGGVPVGIAIATGIKAGLDLLIVRKIPVPWEPEAGYGAIADDGTVVLNEQMVKGLGLSKAEIKLGRETVKEEMGRRRLVLKDKWPTLDLAGKTAVIVDDGLASGFTMIAAIRSVRLRKAGKVVVAVPCASKAAFERVSRECDELVALYISDTSWFAVASFYENWHDLNYSEVLNLLEEWRLTHRGVA